MVALADWIAMCAHSPQREGEGTSVSTPGRMRVDVGDLLIIFDSAYNLLGIAPMDNTDQKMNILVLAIQNAR